MLTYSFNEQCTVVSVFTEYKCHIQNHGTRGMSPSMYTTIYIFIYISYIHYYILLQHSHCPLRTLINIVVDPVKLDQTPSAADHRVCILFPPKFEHRSFRCVHDMSATIFSAGIWVDPSQMSNHLIGEFRPLSKDRKAWIIICTQHAKYQIS